MVQVLLAFHRRFPYRIRPADCQWSACSMGHPRGGGTGEIEKGCVCVRARARVCGVVCVYVCPCVEERGGSKTK